MRSQFRSNCKNRRLIGVQTTLIRGNQQMKCTPTMAKKKMQSRRQIWGAHWNWDRLLWETAYPWSHLWRRRSYCFEILKSPVCKNARFLREKIWNYLKGRAKKLHLRYRQARLIRWYLGRCRLLRFLHFQGNYSHKNLDIFPHWQNAEQEVPFDRVFNFTWEI